MIFVSGDVHDMDMGGADQGLLTASYPGTEMHCAVKYAHIAARYRVRVSLFVSGRAAQSEPHALEDLARNPYVEIGGHTWNCLQPPWRHILRERLTGSFYGSYNRQFKDIRGTLREIGRVTGTSPLSWRTHAYRGDSVTNRILDDQGCRVVSDTVGPERGIERVGRFLWSLPVNTPPDHEYLFHGRFTPKWHEMDQLLRRRPWMVFRYPTALWRWKRALKELGKKGFGIRVPSRPFGDVYVNERIWTDWLLQEVRDRLSWAGFATLLLHPACMEVLDGMQTFEFILEKLSSQETGFASVAASWQPCRVAS